MGSEEGACNPFGLNLSPIAEVTAGNKAALRVFSESSSVGNGDWGDTFGCPHTLVGIQGNDAAMTPTRSVYHLQSDYRRSTAGTKAGIHGSY